MRSKHEELYEGAFRRLKETEIGRINVSLKKKNGSKTYELESKRGSVIGQMMEVVLIGGVDVSQQSE